MQTRAMAFSGRSRTAALLLLVLHVVSSDAAPTPPSRHRRVFAAAVKSVKHLYKGQADQQGAQRSQRRHRLGGRHMLKRSFGYMGSWYKSEAPQRCPETGEHCNLLQKQRREWSGEKRQLPGRPEPRKPILI